VVTQLALLTFEQFGQTGTGLVYLVGFCHLREEVRHFRIDRIQSIIYPEGLTSNAMGQKIWL